jgi:hypothetical protein
MFPGFEKFCACRPPMSMMFSFEIQFKPFVLKGQTNAEIRRSDEIADLSSDYSKAWRILFLST